jgi:hypothetical protein
MLCEQTPSASPPGRPDALLAPRLCCVLAPPQDAFQAIIDHIVSHPTLIVGRAENSPTVEMLERLPSRDERALLERMMPDGVELHPAQARWTPAFAGMTVKRRTIQCERNAL